MNCTKLPIIKKIERLYADADYIVCAPGGIDMGGFQNWVHIALLSLAKKMQKEPKSSPKGDNVPNIVKEIEIALSEMHGTPVKVSYKDGKGSLTITFNSDEQLKEISKLLEK